MDNDSYRAVIDGVTLRLARPDELDMKWVGQEEAMEQMLASWADMGPNDPPLNPRLVGKPGVGKTTLAYAAASILKRDVYLIQGTMDTRPEDLLISPVVGADNKIEYAASPLVTAMIKGGAAVLDEGNRMSEKSWASLAPLLDSRRYVESVVAGIKIKAHPKFLFCATMNDDSSTYELPEYIHSRLQPQICVDFPERDEELAILKSNLPGFNDKLLRFTVDFLQTAHREDENYTVRDGLTAARFAARLMSRKGMDEREALEKAVASILGEEAAGYV